MITCLKCKRWKLFDDKPCPDHPDFKTAQEIEDEDRWRAANEVLKVMFYVAGLRTTAAMGRSDLRENVNRNLSCESEDIQEKVVAEVERQGLMTASELTDSLMMAVELRRRQR